jgi:hypothetical protein
MCLHSDLEDGSYRMRGETRFDEVAWEKTWAPEHALRICAAVLDSQSREIPDEDVVVTYTSR